jgi:hypothetical protein
MSGGNDPYAGLLGQFREFALAGQRPGICEGVVKAHGMVGGKLRLVIYANGMMLDNDDLMVPPELLYDHQEQLAASWTGLDGTVNLAVNSDVKIDASCGYGAHVSATLYDVPGELTGHGSATLTVKSRRLQVGDRVLLQPSEDGQTYYVLCKVVRP